MGNRRGGAGGNTGFAPRPRARAHKSRIQMAQSKNWTFTINNPSDEDLKLMSVWLDMGVRGYAYEEEVGASGTPHYQGYLCFRGKQTLKKCKELNKRAHWEIMKGSLKQNQEYCSKEGKLVVVGKLFVPHIFFIETEFPYERVGHSRPYAAP